MYRSAEDGRIRYVESRARADARLHGRGARRQERSTATSTPIRRARARCVAQVRAARPDRRRRGRVQAQGRPPAHRPDLGPRRRRRPTARAIDAWVTDVTALRASNADLERTASILDLVVGRCRDLLGRRSRPPGAAHRRRDRAGARLRGEPVPRPHARTRRTARTRAASIRSRSTAARSPARRSRFENEYRGKQLSNTVAPYRNCDGAIIGAIGTCIDVTAARTLERRMVDAQRAESLGVLAGGLAHDFNNLLVGVLGNADLALREIPRGAPGPRRGRGRPRRRPARRRADQPAARVRRPRRRRHDARPPAPSSSTSCCASPRRRPRRTSSSTSTCHRPRAARRPDRRSARSCST